MKKGHIEPLPTDCMLIYLDNWYLNFCSYEKYSRRKLFKDKSVQGPFSLDKIETRTYPYLFKMYSFRKSVNRIPTL